MAAYLAVLRHTVKTLVKSPSYILSGLLSLFIAFGLPFFIVGKTDIIMQFQLAITYTIGLTSTIIFLCCLWNGCSIMAKDVESYRIHMVVSKPVKRSSYFLGRFTGTSFVYLILLFISIFAFYLSLKLLPHFKSLDEKEVKELVQKVFITKKSYLPLLQNLSNEIDAEVAEKLQIAKKENRSFTETEISDLKKRAYYSRLAINGEVKPQSSKEFKFELLKSLASNSAFLVFTPYIGAIDVLEKQKRDSINGDCFISVNDSSYIKVNISDNKLISNERYTVKLSELLLNLPLNKVTLKFKNYDKVNSVFFRLNETPEILVDYCSFFENLMRTTLLLVLGVLLMSAIGCALGGFLSLPIAIFVIIFYLFFGSLSSYILSDAQLYRNSKDINMKIGYSLSNTLVKVISPIQSFQQTDEISSGSLLEFSTIREIFEKYFAIQLIVFVSFGIYLFYKREFGIVVRK